MLVVFTRVLLFSFLITGLPHSFAETCVDAMARLGKGATFLHQRNNQLHEESYVHRVVETLRSLGMRNPDSPVTKISYWLMQLERIQARENGSIRLLRRLKRHYHRRLVTRSEDVPQSYFDLQVRIKREQGYGNVSLSVRQRNDLVRVLQGDQRDSLDNWLEYFFSRDTDHYPIWAKLWAFEGMTKLVDLNPETWTYRRRSRSTTAPYAELNREALAIVMDAIMKRVERNSIEGVPDELAVLARGGNFGRMYAWALRQLSERTVDLSVVRGEWVRYQRGSDHMPLVQSLQGRNTGWCTVSDSTARFQLMEGDFYVYYSLDEGGRANVPRVAIRLKEGSIAEVRGVASQQNLDSEIAGSGILERKLAEFGVEGESYLRRSEDMRRLTEIEHRLNYSEDLSREDLRFLYEIDHTINGFGYQRDPRINQLLSRRVQREDLARIFNTTVDRISITREEALSGNIIYHFGDLDLSDLDGLDGISLPHYVRGSLLLNSVTSLDNVTLPQHVEGSLNLSSVTSLDNVILPQHVRYSLYLESVTSLDNVVLPQHVGSGFDLSSLTSLDNVVLPQHVGGYLDLGSVTSLDNVTLPQHVGGHLILGRVTSLDNVVLPEHVGSNLKLNRVTSLDNVTFPRYIGFKLQLNSLERAGRIILPEEFLEFGNRGKRHRTLLDRIEANDEVKAIFRSRIRFRGGNSSHPFDDIL